MELTPTQTFSIRPIPDPDIKGRAWQSRLVVEGEATSTRVMGVELEAQYRIGDRHLLLLDDGTPFEGGMHAYLLGPNLEIVDRRDLGLPYNPGFLHGIHTVGPREVEFSFFSENDTWRLAVLEKPRRMWRDLTHEFRLHMWEGWRLLRKRHLELRRIS
jgi:hypothetical protein